MRTWFALLAAPVLMLADQSISYATAGWACSRQNTFAPHAIHAVFLAVAIAAAIAAFGLWRATAAPGNDETLRRRHFLAGVATGSAALSALVIAAMWLPNWALSPCFN